MAARAETAAKETSDEILVQNHAVSLCLLANRRARVMRVIDFRAGAAPGKAAFVLAAARREEAHKVYTLVERDEVATWVKLGFRKEGNVSGFYKRSDAFLLGTTLDALEAHGKTSRARDAATEAAASERRMKSETRISLRASRTFDFDEEPFEVQEPDHDDDDDLEVTEPSEKAPRLRLRDSDQPDPAQDHAERTLVLAKKQAKALAGKPLPGIKITRINEANARRAVDKATRAGRALTGFEPFGRGALRDHMTLTTRGGFEVVASTESQECFGNSFVELLTAPRNEAEKWATVAGLGALCDRLREGGVVGSFAFSPSDDVDMASCFVANGFRRTGLLRSHLMVGGPRGGARRDAILWSRKLANPTGED